MRRWTSAPWLDYSSAGATPSHPFARLIKRLAQAVKSPGVREILRVEPTLEVGDDRIGVQRRTL
jgi:hypothetical protein